MHRSGDERLQLLIGPPAAQIDIPLRHAWPPVAEREGLLGKVVSYINTAGERSEAARQVLPTSAPPAAETTELAAPSSARHAFPKPPVRSVDDTASRTGPSGPDVTRAAVVPGHRR